MRGVAIVQTVTFDGGWIATWEVILVGHSQSAGVVLSSLARVVWTTTINVIWILGVESIFETLGLIQIKLLCRLGGGRAYNQTVYKTPIRNADSYKRKVTHNVHRVPLFAKDLADLTGAHHLVCGGHLWPALSGEDHKGVHGTFWRPVCVKRLGNQRIGESRAVFVIFQTEFSENWRRGALEADHWSEPT